MEPLKQPTYQPRTENSNVHQLLTDCIEQPNIETIKLILNKYHSVQMGPHQSTPLFSVIYQVVRNDNLDEKTKKEYISLVAETIKDHGHAVNVSLPTTSGDTLLEYLAYHYCVLQNQLLRPVSEALLPYLNLCQQEYYAKKQVEGLEVNIAINSSVQEASSLASQSQINNNGAALNEGTFNIVADILRSEPPPRFEGYAPKCSPHDPLHLKPDWLKVAYPNKSRDELFAMARSNDAYRPTMLSIAQINAAYDYCRETLRPEYGRGPAFYIAEGCDALTTQSLPCMKNAVWIFATQGHILEGITRQEVELEAYSSDKTQGPRSQKATADAAVARFVYSDESDMFAGMLRPGLVDYVNGYMSPYQEKISEATRFFQENYNAIRMNVQQVRVDGASPQDDHYVTQVSVCAPALGGYLSHELFGPWLVDFFDTTDNNLNETQRVHLKEFSEAVLMHQYRSAAMVAILKASVTGNRIPLVICPVGAGTFGNNIGTVRECMQSAVDLVKESGAPVDVVLSLYGDDEFNSYKTIYDQKAYKSYRYEQLAKLPNGVFPPKN